MDNEMSLEEWKKLEDEQSKLLKLVLASEIIGNRTYMFILFQSGGYWEYSIGYRFDYAVKNYKDIKIDEWYEASYWPYHEFEEAYKVFKDIIQKERRNLK